MNVSMSTLAAGLNTLTGLARVSAAPGGGASASASDGAGSISGLLAALDGDQSGSLSAQEIADSPLARFITEDNWADVDTDGNGALDADELKSHRDSVMGGAGGPPPGAPPDAPSGADPMSLIQSLLDDIASSSAATENTASYARDLYSAVQNLLGSLDM